MRRVMPRGVRESGFSSRAELIIAREKSIAISFDLFDLDDLLAYQVRCVVSLVTNVAQNLFAITSSRDCIFADPIRKSWRLRLKIEKPNTATFS